MLIYAVVGSICAGACLFCAITIDRWDNKREWNITFSVCSIVTIICAMILILWL